MTVPQRRKQCWTEFQFKVQEGWELKQQGKNITIYNICFFFHFKILLSLRFFFKTCLKKRVLILNAAKFPNGKIILY